MKHRDDPDLELERLVHRALRTLPPRRAPSSLEMRVLQELSQHAARPWWHRSFLQWPRAVRTLFVGVCTALGGLITLGGTRIVWTVHPGRGIERKIAVLRATGDALSALAHSIPPGWIYEALLFAALLYAVLFVLGAAAYRTLYLDA